MRGGAHRSQRRCGDPYDLVVKRIRAVRIEPGLAFIISIFTSPTSNHHPPRTLNQTMSHFSTIQTQIKDLNALRSALGEMHLPLLTNTQARGYSTQSMAGDFVIRLNGPYDIAVNRQPDGTYGLTTDWWAGHVEKEVGANYGRLLQLYGVHKATREARRKGLSVRRKAQADGSIKLTVTGV